jgi:hypothetical protein
MSQGSITYQGIDEVCGITTVINSELRNHRVCDDGLACVEQYLDGTSLNVKKCKSTAIPPGYQCNPVYIQCGTVLTCVPNEYELFTCGGSSIWDGNDIAIKSNTIKTSSYEQNIVLVIIGLVLIFMDIMLYLYYFF